MMQNMIDEGEIKELLVAFVKRAICDAAGPEDLNSNIVRYDFYNQKKAREYLTQGYIVEFGYYQSENPPIKFSDLKNKKYKEKSEKFKPTQHPQYSPIKLHIILDYLNIDHQAFNMYIENWKKDDWSRTNPWYVNFMKVMNNETEVKQKAEIIPIGVNRG